METVAPLYVGKLGCVFWDPNHILDKHLTAFVFHGIKEEGKELIDVRCVYLIKQGEQPNDSNLKKFFEELSHQADLLIDENCFVGDVNVLWSNGSPTVYPGDYERGVIHALLCDATKNRKFIVSLEESRRM